MRYAASASALMRGAPATSVAAHRLGPAAPSLVGTLAISRREHRDPFVPPAASSSPHAATIPNSDRRVAERDDKEDDREEETADEACVHASRRARKPPPLRKGPSYRERLLEKKGMRKSSSAPQVVVDPLELPTRAEMAKAMKEQSAKLVVQGIERKEREVQEREAQYLAERRAAASARAL
jgi:hypothetical protein